MSNTKEQWLEKWYEEQRKHIAMTNSANSAASTQLPLPYVTSTGLPTDFDTWQRASSMSAMMVPTKEPMVDYPFVIEYYNQEAMRYERVWAQNDEDAITKAQEIMQSDRCGQVMIFERTHMWLREWQKK